MSKAKRRQYATGAVYQRSSDGRWIGTLETGWTRTGSRRRVTVSATSEAECKRRLRDKRLQIERDGLPSADAAGRVTVKAWAETWLAAQTANVRPKTWLAYRSAIRRWVIPTIGHKRIDTLTPGDVRAVAAAQRRAGRSSTTALHTQSVLTALLIAARAEGHQVPARVTEVKRPAKAANDREALTTAEAVAVLDVAASLPDASRWVAALLQGMRQGECLGLTWAAVDLDRELLDVSWQLQALPYLDRKAQTFRVPDGYESRRLDGAWHLVRPKTGKGQRLIPLVPWMATALKSWSKVAPASPHDLVWPRLDGRPVDVKTDSEEWRALQGTAGVGHPAGRYYHLHEARHTTATLLLEAGVDQGVVTAILGHSSIVTSRGYQHTSQAQARLAMERVAEQLQLTR